MASSFAPSPMHSLSGLGPPPSPPWPQSPAQSFSSAQSAPAQDENDGSQQFTALAVRSEGALPLSNEGEDAISGIIARAASNSNLVHPSIQQVKAGPKRNSSPLSIYSGNVQPFEVDGAESEIRAHPSPTHAEFRTSSTFHDPPRATLISTTPSFYLFPSAAQPEEDKASRQVGINPSEFQSASLHPSEEGDLVEPFPDYFFHNTLPHIATKASEDVVPFSSWLRSLIKGSHSRRRAMSDSSQVRTSGHAREKSSSTQSSNPFVTRPRNHSQLSASVITSGQPGVITRRGRSHTVNSHLSRRSGGGGRLSTESVRAPPDPLVLKRAADRHHCIEEIVNAEEGYLIDIKVFENVYFTMLPISSAFPEVTRRGVHRIVTDLIQLHEEIVEELRAILERSKLHPFDGYTTEHNRKKSRALEVVVESVEYAEINDNQEDELRMPTRSDSTPSPILASPDVAGDIARVFDRKIRSFSVYEEYAVHHDALKASIRALGPQAMAKGVERYRLSHAVGRAEGKSASTSLDLVTKPMQKLLRYPLLFSELLKVTPVCDDPDSYTIIEKVYFKFSDRAREVNNAQAHKNHTKDRMEKTWTLQDRLKCDYQPDFVTVRSIRSLGHIILCGALYVTWQEAPMVITGEYLVCLLFRSVLVFASVGANRADLNIMASITLADARIEGCSSTEGLAVENAPCSFRLEFQSAQQLYEVILTATSLEEEMTWRNAIAERLLLESNEAFRTGPAVNELLGPFKMQIESLGSSYGLTKVLSRRLSLDRVSSAGSRSPMKPQRIVIRNDVAMDVQETYQKLRFNRTRSLINPEKLHVLVPRPADRNVLEHALEEVWTVDQLPFRSHDLARAHNQAPRRSASRLMKMVSMSAFPLPLHKRSTSHLSLRHAKRTSDRPSVARASTVSALGSSDILTGESQHHLPAEASDGDAGHRGFSFRRSARSQRPTLEAVLADAGRDGGRPGTGEGVSGVAEGEGEEATGGVGTRRGLRRRIRDLVPFAFARRALEGSS